MKSRRLMLALAVAMVTVAALVSAAAVTASGDAPARTMAITCASPSMGGSLPALVYLPVGYRPAGKPYPVIYFLHGLPANPTSYTSNSFVANALRSAGQRAIVVAPQGARSANSDREYLDWSPTEDWPRAISHDLTHCIDHRYHTVANRTGRALVGLSAGGYGAFNIGLRNLQTFGAVESWSGYFVATDPTGLHILDLGSALANAAATVPRGSALAADLAKWPALIAFYVGNQDGRFLEMNKQYDAQLTASKIKHTFRIYPGGHSGALWRGEAPSWLTMALKSLSADHRKPAPRSERGGVGLTP
ncbi:MAG: alpha/beta hydrolase-fold protein [Solirubrobacteraceae bacterium]